MAVVFKIYERVRHGAHLISSFGNRDIRAQGRWKQVCSLLRPLT